MTGDDEGDAAAGAADPGVEAALARTRSDLADHADRVEQRVRDEPGLPPDVLAGLDRTLAAERPPRRAGPTPTGVRRRWAIMAAAAAAALVVLIVLVTGAGPGASAPVATPPPDPTPRLRGDDVLVAWRSGLGRADYGRLADPARRTGCLAAHGVVPPSVPVGARPVVLDGRPGVLMILTTGVAARFRVLVVDPGCGPGDPRTLADRVVGR